MRKADDRAGALPARVGQVLGSELHEKQVGVTKVTIVSKSNRSHLLDCRCNLRSHEVLTGCYNNELTDKWCRSAPHYVKHAFGGHSTVS